MILPRRACIIDVETTGLDPSKDSVIEVACILYDLKLASPIASFSALSKSDSNAAEHINGIPVALLSEAFEQENVWFGVTALWRHADVILAHRAEFDKSFLDASDGFAACWHGGGPPVKPWVCTKFHVAWPNAKSSEHLVHLALSYGVGVLAAHRALTDCDTIARILTRVHELGTDLQELIGQAMKPRQRVEAIVSFAQKELAKEAGFAWDPSGKRWTREVTAEEVEKGWKFKTRVIG